MRHLEPRWLSALVLLTASSPRAGLAQVPPSPPPTEARGDAAADAAVDAFLAQNDLSLDGSEGPSLKLYGFADFSYGQYLVPSDSPWRVFYNSQGSFAVGNLNLYLDARLHETVRSLTEVRFTYLPFGSITDVGPPTERNKDLSSDYTRNERDVIVGGVRIERALLEWSPHQLARVTLGHWLTPYGIWNVDHGSPTIVPASRPFLIDEQLLPEAQTGVLLEGRAELDDSWALEYGFGLSNGRGPIDVFFDFDSNRAVTGRLKLSFTGLGELALGASSYVGRYTDAVTGITLVDGSLASTDDILEQYDELAFAGDVRWQYGGLLLQSEVMMNERAFTDEGRPPLYSASDLAPDDRRIGVYALGGYRFSWLGVMPYAVFEYSPVPPTGARETPREVLVFGGGLNVRPIAQVVVKADFTHALLPENRPRTFDEHPLNRLVLQVAWAF
jgi:hypothetical protein